ncbi:hypothetical protein WICPIJ_008381 [Wickerhamomyces pijperi]|uniref:Uncharacterized protein n=1 Tax=Wickerhamomyces pijperi TaxID=599730 RepID=A0A9P8PXJ0_WICPI|nr:hypothetical protein WICPIJ_008381 [Wickerhamomyces pijperi]
MSVLGIITFFCSTLLSPAYWSAVIKKARAKAKEGSQIKTIDQPVLPDTTTETLSQEDEDNGSLEEKEVEPEESIVEELETFSTTAGAVATNPEEVSYSYDSLDYDFADDHFNIATTSHSNQEPFATVDGLENAYIMDLDAFFILACGIFFGLLYGLRKVSLMAETSNMEFEQESNTNHIERDAYYESFNEISDLLLGLEDNTSSINDKSLNEEDEIRALIDQVLSDDEVLGEQIPPMSRDNSTTLEPSTNAADEADAVENVSDSDDTIELAEDNKEFGPFTLDSEDQVELVTMTTDGNYSLFLKKEAAEEVPGSSNAPKSKVHIMLKVNKKQPISDFHILSDLPITGNQDIIVNRTTIHPLRDVLNSADNLSLYSHSLNKSVESLLVLDSDDDKENCAGSRGSENFDMVSQSSCDVKETSRPASGSSIQSSEVFKTPTKQPKTVRIIEPASVHRIPIFEDCSPNRSHRISPRAGIQRYEDLLPRKGSILRVVYNEDKSNKDTPTRQPVRSPIKVLAQAREQFSPRPISKQEMFRISEEVDEFFFRGKTSLEVSEEVGEQFLNDIFGEDIEVSFDEDELLNFITEDIDKVTDVYKGKETVANWNQRCENFDILIGHLRTRFPEELHGYFMDRIYENLESILEMTNTTRSELLFKVVIFVRDLIYFGRGQELPDEVYVTLLHVLLPLTKTSQTVKLAYNSAFKSLCLMIRAIDIGSFINNFDVTFSAIIKDKKLKGEKFTSLFMIKFYILSNMQRANENGELFAEVIAAKLVPMVPLLNVDSFQKTRLEIVDIYLILHKVIPTSETLAEYYEGLSSFNKLKVPIPERFASEFNMASASVHDQSSLSIITSPLSITTSLDSWNHD